MSALERIEPVHLPSFLERLVGAFALGNLIEATPIEKGYEDCNLYVVTSRGRYVVKVFARSRRQTEVVRYTDVIRAATAANCHQPDIVALSNGDLMFADNESGLSVIVMLYVDGDDFVDLQRTPTARELDLITSDLARLHRVETHIPALFDSWAVPNIAALADEVAVFVDDSMNTLVAEAVARIGAIRLGDLPHALVHGDLTKANVRLGTNGVPVLLDFAVANVYPRIQELAVMAANLMYDGTTSLQRRCSVVAGAYSKHDPLSELEADLLFDYSVGATAMEYLGSLKEKYVEGNDNSETDYWLELGRKGLAKALRP